MGSIIAERDQQTNVGRYRQIGLDGFTFFMANIQTGFGPFVSVYLSQQKWAQPDIFLVLTIANIVALLFQIPCGMYVDYLMTHKRSSLKKVAGISTFFIAFSALSLTLWTSFLFVSLALVLHSVFSAIITPAISLITILTTEPKRLGRRFGRNAGCSSAGNALAASLMGIVGTYATRYVFYITSVLMVPAMFALYFIPVNHHGSNTEILEKKTSTGDHGASFFQLLTMHFKNKTLLVFAVVLMIYYTANAAIPSFVGSVMTQRSTEYANLYVALTMIIPPLIVTFLAPFVGKWADIVGRYPFLLLSFIVLLIKGIWFAYLYSPEFLTLVQFLDGIPSAIFAVMIPLVTADLTKRTGGYSFALGMIGLMMQVGASFSTYLVSELLTRYNTQQTFLGLALVGFIGFLFMAVLMKETKDSNSEASKEN